MTIEQTSKRVLIKCPHCGAEYTVDEIYTPAELEGKTENVVKDALGKILYVEYKENCEPEASANFICDYCNKPFVVESTLSFKSKKQEEALDFSNLSSSLLN